MTADDYARAVIIEGQSQGITPVGIQIALATVYVESDFVMYANAAVPASMTIPHDAVGSDGFSVGLFQQQVVMGANGQWWWGSAAQCMDPATSAGFFYSRLAALDYNDTANTPGSYAQDIQQSAFPDRYDQQFPAAVTLYNRLAGAPVTNPTDPRLAALQAARPDFNEFPNSCSNNEPRNGTPVDLWLVHTEESSGYDDALGLSNFLISTEGGPNPVSYHYTISKGQDDDGVTVVDVVDTDQACWAVMASNDRSINLCFAGSSVSWSRDEWITNLGRCIDVAGYLAVQDAIKYGFDPTRITFGAPNGTGYNLAPPVVSDHRYCTDYLKDGNTHVDVGDNFPADLLTASIQKYWTIANGAPAPTPVPAPPVPVPAPPVPGGNVPNPPNFPQQPTDINDAIFQIWGALFNAIPSESRYATPGGLYMTKDFINFTDARVHEINVERLALMGEPDAVALVKTAAAAGDTIAALVLAKINANTGQPVTPAS